MTIGGDRGVAVRRNLRPGLPVGLPVEVSEEEEEHDGVHADPPHEGLRVVAVDEEQLERVQHYEHKLGLKQKKAPVKKNRDVAGELFGNVPAGGW